MSVEASGAPRQTARFFQENPFTSSCVWCTFCKRPLDLASLSGLFPHSLHGGIGFYFKGPGLLNSSFYPVEFSFSSTEFPSRCCPWTGPTLQGTFWPLQTTRDTFTSFSEWQSQQQTTVGTKLSERRRYQRSRTWAGYIYNSGWRQPSGRNKGVIQLMHYS